MSSVDVVVGEKMMGSRVPDLSYSAKRRGLVGFSIALSILLAFAVIYQKFLLDRSGHGGSFERLPTFLCSESRSSGKTKVPSPDSNSCEKVLVTDDLDNSDASQIPNNNTPSSSSSSNTESTPFHDPSHSCISRSESPSYQNPSPHKPSPHLLSALRSYENLHRQCGPYTTAYNRTITYLLNNNSATTTDDDLLCNYIIWTPTDGLGNQIISLASTFLYAILTRRVLLVNFGPDISDLFCEPFPYSSWLLPSNFPHFNSNNNNSEFHSLKTLQTLINENNSNSTTRILYVDLHDISGDKVKFIHCTKTHKLLQNIPILILKSNLYFTPALFITPIFKPQLTSIFPQPSLVFHHLGRYLFHPSDTAWTQIMYHYTSHLSNADIKLGLQIRVFWYEHVTDDLIMKQIISCTNNLLPKPDHNRTSTAVLVTSLKRDYAERLRVLYGGSREVSVYQASMEEKQRFNNGTQNMMAWVEMYLLSLCDELVTTGQSTFGYVAQGLSGLRSVVMRIESGRDKECYRAETIDPCFMVAPRGVCDGNVSSGEEVVKVCEDREQGIRLTE